MADMPTPILPRHPDWVSLYRRAWQEWTATQGMGDAAARLAVMLAATDDDAEAAHERAAQQLAAPAMATHPADIIRLILRDLLGLRMEADARLLRWHLLEAPPCGIRHLPLGQNTISLYALGDVGGGIAVDVEAARPFFLEIETLFTLFSETMPAGRSRLLLTHLDRTDVRTERP